MHLLILSIIFVLLGGCAKKRDLQTIYWNSEDLEIVTNSMVVSILNSKALNNSSKKVFYFLKIKNETYDHVDTKSIIESIKTGLIKSKKVKIVDTYKKDIDGIFFGEISAIYQKNSLLQDMFFKLTLNLVDVKSAQIIWSDEKKIRKIYKKAYLGW